MPSKATRWTFKQLGGPRKTLILEDHAAPHGAPRRGEVHREAIKARAERVYYPGNDIPTRHIFGAQLEDVELKGHWTDRFGGPGFAIAKKEETKAFVADLQPVQVTWSDIVSFKGFITVFDPGPQGARDVDWKMTIEVDSDNFLENVPVIPNAPPAKTFTNQIIAALSDPLGKLPDLPLDGDLLGALDNLVSDINGITASLNGIADQIGGFSTALLSELRRFRAGLGQLRTALIKLRNTFDNFKTGVALESRRAEDQQRYFGVRAGIEASVVESLKQIAEADRQAMLAERGRIKTLYVAQSSDTWESIAIRSYGDAGRAGDIREANEIPAGQAPEAGAIYQIPR